MTTTTTIRTLLVLAFLCLLKLVVSQPTRYYFDHLTTQEGLSQNDVNCILQDSLGFMWFGTNDGLNLYDGYDFTVFKPNDGDPTAIISNIIQDLAEDQLGRIWVGTADGGISCFLPRYQRFVNLKEAGFSSFQLPSDFIIGLDIDSQDRLWIWTPKGLKVFQISGAYELNEGTLEDITEALLPSRVLQVRINDMYEESPHIFWLATNNGLFRLEKTAQTSQKLEAERLIKHNTKGIHKGPNGQVWVTSPIGLYQIEQKGPHQFQKHRLDRRDHDQIIYNAGAIWTSSSLGLAKYVESDTSRYPTKEHVYVSNLSDPHSLSKTVLRTIYADRNGIIWIGTNGGGVNKFEPKQKTFFHYKKTLTSGSLSYDKVRAAYEDSYQNLWIGTEGGGLNFLPASDSQMNHYDHFSNIPKPANVFALAEYECKGRRYMLMGGQMRPGLHQIPLSVDMNSIEGLTPSPFQQIKSSVFAILNVDNCAIWVGTYHNGLYLLDVQNQQVSQQFTYQPDKPGSISSNLTRSLLQDKAGNIWIGTGRGLNRLDADQVEKPNPTFVNYLHDAEDPSSISHDYILALFEAKNGDVWIGTFGGGLNKFVPATPARPAHFISYTEAEGLPNNVVKGILEDAEGFLWLSTNKGLTRFNPHTGTFYNFDTKDGLQSDEFSELAQLKRKNGDMIFGGVNGFNVFKASSVHINPNPPQLALTELQILNKKVKEGEAFNNRVLLEQAISYTPEIRLKHHENSFSLGFSAFHYRAPEKNKYAYMLEGLHDDWIYVGADKRFVNFTNLDPGTYVFKIKAANSDGIWNNNPTEITIHIAPPFWLTWWAFLLYAVILVGVMWLLAHYTFIGIREKHQLVLEHLEKEKTEELQQMKLQFFTNISHELRTPLSLISGPMDYLIESGKGLSYEQREKQYQLIRKNAQYLLRLANQLLDFRKVDQGIVKLQTQKQDIVKYIQEISEPFQFIARKQSISFEIDAYPKEIISWFDTSVVEKIVYNLLSNAFKYTPERGKIRLEVRTSNLLKDQKSGKEPQLIIRVRDTGLGIPKKDRQRVFQRFFKGDQPPAHHAVGVGIGLSYTKELVKLHHGSIWVEDNHPKGTCFVVSLPMEEKSYAPEEKLIYSKGKESPNPSVSTIPKPFSTGLELASVANGQHAANEEFDSQANEEGDMPLMLIIDDNEDIRTFLHEAFKAEYQILEAGDGQQGWELAQEHGPSLILSDVMMPQMNGIELCTKLKEDQQTSHIPIILLTAKTAEESELEGLRNGADDYIRKPFRIDVLRYKITNILKRREEMQKRFRREVILEPKEVTITSADEMFLQKTMDLIEENMTEPDFNVEAMVKEIGMSRSKLYLKLKALTGQSSSEFIRTIRLKRAAQLLESSGLTVKEIMYMTGFNTASYFSKCFKKQFGVVPSEYVRQQKPVLDKS